ncbi:MAG: hypothetical protein P4L27_12365 [Ignavibacteriaceae bacterium]|nr:hypothetical protein [Ignavibacteriaceae bacterium]
MKPIILFIILFSAMGFAQEFHSTSIKTTGRIYASQDTLLSITIDWSMGNTKIKSLTANTTFNMINTVNGAQISVVVYNSGTFTVDWTCSEAPIVWSGGIAPVQTTGGKTDIYSFIRAGGKIYGTYIQNF